MTYAPGDCFTLTPDSAAFFKAPSGAVYRVKARSAKEGQYIADGLPLEVSLVEMLPHPGPASVIPKKPRRRPGGRDLRTPLQLFQADIYASIIRHKINALDAIVVLAATVEAIEAGTNEQAAAEAVRKMLKQPARALAAKLVDNAIKLNKTKEN